MIRFQNLSLMLRVVIFNKVMIYYIKKSKVKFWYKNKTPFFRFGYEFS